MALPSALQPNGAVATDFGIEIRITPANPPSYGIELQRAPDNGSGAPNVGAAATLIILPPLRAGGASYVDLLAPDDAFRHYRWRHVADGYDPSANWTAWGRGKPALLPPQLAQGGLIGVYPIMRALALTDGKYALRASEIDGSTKVSDAHNAQGSVPPVNTTDSPFSYASTCVNNSGRGQVTWSWTAFTVYRADGSTIAVPASSAAAVPAAPTVGQVAGGALGARNRRWRVALVKDKVMMGISGETSFNPGASQLAKVTSPTAVPGYDGWIPLVSDATINAEVQQSTVPPSTPIAFGTDWTEPAAGADIPTGTITQWNDSATTTGARVWNLAASETRYYYPRWDVANGLVGFTAAPVTTKSPAIAAQQNGDGYIALSDGGMAGVTPAVGSPGSGTPATGPCLDAATLVESRTRGMVALGSCDAGEELRTRDEDWTRIEYLRRKPQGAWIRVRVGTGARLLITRQHPMVTAVGIRRAVELSLGDLLVVPGGFAEIAELSAVFEAREQVDLVCTPQEEFWAGEEAGRWLLTHNARTTS